MTSVCLCVCVELSGAGAGGLPRQHSDEVMDVDDEASDDDDDDDVSDGVYICSQRSVCDDVSCSLC